MLDQPPGAARAASAGPSFAVVTGILGVVAASWVLAIDQIRSMDEGVATNLGSFGSFAGSWIAMMVPGAIPGVLRGSRDSGHPSSGLVFGLNRVGSSAGLMAILVVVGVMSVTWMIVVAAVIAAQKLLRARAVVDVPLALAIGVLGVVILTAPSLIPGLAPTAGPVPMM